jgi:hypothetical protein
MNGPDMTTETTGQTGWPPGPAARLLDAAALAFFATLVLIALVRTEFLTGPLYGDEKHFFPSTVALVPFRFEKLASLKELSSPTFFVAVSFVLSLLGPNIVWCRLLVLGALIGCVTLYRRSARAAARELGLPPLVAPLSLVLLLTFPYLVGCGVHYYTDVPALLFGLLSFSAYRRGRTVPAVLWAVLAVHCRQFFMFIPAGASAAEGWRWLGTRDRRALGRAALWLLPVGTLLPYIVLWGGPSPLLGLDPRMAALPAVQPRHVTYLFGAAGLYLLPLGLGAAALGWNRTKAACCAAAVLLFCVFPPRPNLYYQIMGAPIRTLGVLDSALRNALGHRAALVALAAAVVVAAALHYELFARARTAQRGGAKWMIAAFWGMNLFSHLTWDKYLLPVLPLLYLTALRHPAARRLGALGNALRGSQAMGVA